MMIGGTDDKLMSASMSISTVHLAGEARMYQSTAVHCVCVCWVGGWGYLSIYFNYLYWFS